MTAGEPAENKMGAMNVWRLIVTLALPIAASMLVRALYGIVYENEEKIICLFR